MENLEDNKEILEKYLKKFSTITLDLLKFMAEESMLPEKMYYITPGDFSLCLGVDKDISEEIWRMFWRYGLLVRIGYKGSVKAYFGFNKNMLIKLNLCKPN